MNKRPITHQHRANVTKISSRLSDKDSQPPVYQVGLGQRVYILPGALWATLGHLPPIPQHPRTPGHKAFRSQLTANELGVIRFAGVGPKWSTIQPRSAGATPLRQPRDLGIWGRYLPKKIPHLSGTPDAHGNDLQLMPPQGHHTRRPPTTVPIIKAKIFRSWNSISNAQNVVTYCQLRDREDQGCHIGYYTWNIYKHALELWLRCNRNRIASWIWNYFTAHCQWISGIIKRLSRNTNQCTAGYYRKGPTCTQNNLCIYL